MHLSLTEPLSGSFPTGGIAIELTSQRTTWRGTIWHHDRPWLNEIALQRWLDQHASDPRDLFQLDDFLLSYRAPDGNTLLLYRPLTAIHTLYYRITAHTITWSTVIEHLLQNPLSMNDVAIDLIPALVCVGDLDPERTPYREVRCLRAGQCLCIDRSGMIQTFYDDFHWNDNTALPFADAAVQYRELCAAACQQAVWGNDRTGIFLSGGLDSAILALESQQLGYQVEGLHWTWGQFPHIQPERAAAQLVAEMLHVPLHLLDGSADIEPRGNYLQARAHLPLPFTHSFLTSFQASAQCAGEHGLQLCLSGHLGDTLFQTGLDDNLASTFQQGRILAALGDSIADDSRQKALQLVYRWLRRGRTHQSVTSIRERIERCTWLRPEALRHAREHGQYLYQHTMPCAPQDMTHAYQAIYTGINGETQRDSVRCQYALFPRGIALAHPYINRQLIEFCLSLGIQHRALFAAGVPISKPLARYAYLEQLPSQVVRREIRSPYAAMNEYYVMAHREALQSLFSHDACLTQLGVVDSQECSAILEDTGRLRHHAKALLAAASVELWLRSVAGRPWQQPDPPAYRFWTMGNAYHHLSQASAHGYLALARDVHVCPSYGELIMLHKSTGQVMHVDEVTHLFLRIGAQSQSYDEMMDTFASKLETPINATVWREVLETLSQQGWIQLNIDGGTAHAPVSRDDSQHAEFRDGCGH
jgi:asparagine synthetase B (glutamine-hydrolysing)